MLMIHWPCVGGGGGGGPEQPAAGLGDAGGCQDCLLQAERGTVREQRVQSRAPAWIRIIFGSWIRIRIRVKSWIKIQKV